MFTSFEDTQITVESYQRNTYKPRVNYLGIMKLPLVSRYSFPFCASSSIFELFKGEYSSASSVNSGYGSAGEARRVRECAEYSYQRGDHHFGSSYRKYSFSKFKKIDLISILPLAPQKTYIANSEHLDDVISVFVGDEAILDCRWPPSLSQAKTTR